MARKTAGTLEEQRADVKKRYKHGARARRDLVNFENLSETDKAVKMEAACFLKAADFSHTYIGEALGTTRGTVKGWFTDNPKMAARVAEIQADYIDGAVKLLRTYAIELIEMLVDIARTSNDDKIRITAITEALDRMGMAKVNKSQSEVVNKTKVDITDKTKILEAMEHASPEAQQKMAEHLEAALALASEYDVERDVTHA